MHTLIHIGFGNMLNADKIIAILQPDSAPVKRMVQHGKESGMVVDATQGRKTKAVLLMENSRIVLSALTPETLASRVDGQMGEKHE
ncbi:MAG: DUF370 domain-containing protein [Lachnospiraceae bacterium]|nr:DUF370 domain-containing protein [Lachnospiraceae bacterium]